MMNPDYCATGHSPARDIIGLGMSEHGLNHAKALAALEQVGREGVPLIPSSE